jgi:hypothetical protein
MSLPLSLPPLRGVRSLRRPLAANEGIQVMSTVARSGASPDAVATANLSWVVS